MINEQEIKSKALETNTHQTRIEKDYVIGWLLWAIYSDKDIGGNLVLKGGNCLRKAYFQHTRFSDDLDFTASYMDSVQDFRQKLNDACRKVEKACGGIKFKYRETRVNLKDTPDPQAKALDGRIYFSGFCGDSSVTLRIKFDISEYEKIVLPIDYKSLIHPYSDADSCDVMLPVYQIEEVLAEKLRCWIQRTRSRDLFDVVRILFNSEIPVDKSKVLSTFLDKTTYKAIPFDGYGQLLPDQKFALVGPDWEKTIISPSPILFDLPHAIKAFKEFVVSVFRPGQQEVPVGSAELSLGRTGYLNKVSGLRLHERQSSSSTGGYSTVNPIVRENIIQAGKLNRVIVMGYKDLDRHVEPYSFRYKNGREYFFGYDRTKDFTIKSFILDRIEHVEIGSESFAPRWGVEF